MVIEYLFGYAPNAGTAEPAPAVIPLSFGRVYATQRDYIPESKAAAAAAISARARERARAP